MAFLQFRHIVYTGTTADYGGGSRTIRRPVAWNGSSPPELGVFVNAMVRHLQTEAGADYRCTPEQFAAAVQIRWLAMFGAAGQTANGATPNPICTFRQSRMKN